MWEFTELVPVPYQAIGAYILAIGQDADHELYILTTQNSGPSGETGRVYRLIPPPEDPEPSPAPGFLFVCGPFWNYCRIYYAKMVISREWRNEWGMNRWSFSKGAFLVHTFFYLFRPHYSSS